MLLQKMIWACFFPIIVCCPLLRWWTFDQGGSVFYELRTHMTNRGVSVFFYLFLSIWKSYKDKSYLSSQLYRKKNMKLRPFQYWESVDTKHIRCKLNINCFSVNMYMLPLKIDVRLKCKFSLKYWYLWYWESVFYERATAAVLWLFISRQLCPAGGPHSPLLLQWMETFRSILI